MPNFTVDILSRNFAPLLLSRDLTFTYKRGSAHVRGGPVDAEIEVIGPRYMLYELLDYLRNPITVYNSFGTAVWWGYVAEIHAAFNAIQIGLSLDEVNNRMKVIYTYTDPENRPIKAETDWEVDSASIATYGTWELVKSIGNSNTERAETDLANTLALNAWPVGTPVFSTGVKGKDSVTLLCRGWYSTFNAVYYERLEGRETFNGNGTSLVSLGQKFVSDKIGFESNADAIHSLTGYLEYLEPGQWVKITGSVSNNLTAKIKNGTDQDHVFFSSPAMVFEPQDDILGPATLFALISAGEMINITGTPYSSSNGYHWVQSSEQDGTHITTFDKVIIHSSGNTVTLERGNSVVVDAALTRELPTGGTVTLTVVGEKIAQRFYNHAPATWTVYEIWIRAKKINNPVDNLVVELWTNSGGNTPGTLLDSGTISGSTISANSTLWYKANLSGAVGIAPVVNFWIVVRRSGASEIANYYQIDIDENNTYTDGIVKYWDGAAWVDPITSTGGIAVSMPFAVNGKEETTQQITTLEGVAGQFITATQILDRSNLYTNQYRDGKLRASAELESLLDTNTLAGKRLLSTITVERILQIYAEPDYNTNNIVRVDLAGNWYDALDSRLEPGVLPIGKWAEIRDLPPDIGAYTKVTPFFVEESSYESGTDAIQVTPRGAWSTRGAGGLRQG